MLNLTKQVPLICMPVVAFQFVADAQGVVVDHGCKAGGYANNAAIEAEKEKGHRWPKRFASCATLQVGHPFIAVGAALQEE